MWIQLVGCHILSCLLLFQESMYVQYVQWTFLHADLFRIIYIIGFVLMDPLFSSDHRFLVGFKSGDWDGHCRTWMLFYLSIYVWVLMYGWSFLTEANRSSVKMSWNLLNALYHCPLMLNSAPGPLASKYLKNINEPPPYLTVLLVWGASFCMLVYFAAKNVESVYVKLYLI